MPEYVRNHTASACYLRNFSNESERVSVLDLRSGMTNVKKASDVGWTRYFWGKDHKLRRQAEERAGAMESSAAVVLANVEKHWPMKAGGPSESPEWWALVKAMSLHIVRSPAWRQKIIASRQVHLKRGEKEWNLSRRQVQEARKYINSDWFLVDMLLRQIRQNCTLLGHLNWTLLRFPEPCLATSDQPVVATPFLAPGGSAPITVDIDRIPARLEYLWPVDPSHAVLLTWQDGEFLPEPVDLPAVEAININIATKAQAQNEVFWLPGVQPAYVRVPESGSRAKVLSPLVFPEYQMRTAVRSTRWAKAHEAFERMVEDDSQQVEILVLQEMEG